MTMALEQLGFHLPPAWTAAVEPYAALLVLVLAGAIVLLALSARRRSRRAMRQVAELASRQALDERYQQIQSASEAQFAEIKGRLAAMAEMAVQRQSEQAKTHDDRLESVAGRLGATLDAFSQRVGDSLSEAGRRTSDSLSDLNARLALIDEARQTLAELSSEVGSLHDVLADKQARGAFGQARMETIVRDALPPGAYEFQATLSNGKRPDCLVRLPNTPAPLVIDAKFPLEGFEALRAARAPEEIKAAAGQVREAITRHIEEIAEKYLIAGETQDTALMFVPSESVYAQLHERFTDLVQKAYRARIVIVAPNILMLAVQTMQAVIKDVKMRDQAGVIQREVGLLLADVGRLLERSAELDRHFNLAVKALEKISGSADKIARRGERLRSLDLEEETESENHPAPRRISRGS